MPNKSYGKYTVPETLTKLITLQHELKDKGKLPYGDLLGLYFAVEGLESRYINTPLDAIPFARPGVDGIHYGFLTEFGHVVDLEEAYIVRVTPMDFDDPVKIVARNLRDFITLWAWHPPALEVLDSCVSLEQSAEIAKKYQSILGLSETAEVAALVQCTFQLQPFSDVLSYFKGLQQERLKEPVLQTIDGIGVLNKSSGRNEHEKLKLNPQEELNLSMVQLFFSAAGYESKLAFLRDAQSLGLLHENGEVKRYLQEQLLLMNLADEAARLYSVTEEELR